MEYDNTNRGALFLPDNMKVVRHGKVNVEGDENYYVICSVQTKNGNTVYEMYQKVGALFPNDNKRKDDDPDISGTLNLSRGDYMAWGRKGQTKKGDDFTKLSVAPKRNSGNVNAAVNATQTQDQPTVDKDEDIPF